MTNLEKIVVDKRSRMLESGARIGLPGVLDSELISGVLRDHREEKFINNETITIAIKNLRRKGLL